MSETTETTEPNVPKTIAVPALAVAVSAALPLLPDGRTFLHLIAEAFTRSPLDGLLMIFGFGSPYLFALALGIAVVALPSKLGRMIVRTPLAMMHSQLVLVAVAIVVGGDAIAAPALLGFAIVSGIYLAVHTARTAAAGDGPLLGWYARWGAMVIAAVAGWIRLQRAGGLEFGYGLDVMLGAAVLVVVLLGRRSYSGPAPAPSPE